MSTKQHYYSVVRNGKLTLRIQKILDEYKQKYKVDVVRVLRNEYERLQNKQMFLKIFTDEQEQICECVARVRALRQILDVIEPTINS